MDEQEREGNVKIYYINLKNSVARRKSMETGFSDNEELVRVESVDGMKWASRKKDDRGFPLWKKGEREKLVKEGILLGSSKLPPTHVACNIGHRLAVQAFLDSGEEWGMIMEDDVEPTEALLEAWESVGDEENGSQGLKLEDVLEMPDDCDMYYLCGDSHRGMRVNTFSDGQIRKARTLMGYALSRKGAEVFMKATVPMEWLSDSQFLMCAYESFSSRIAGVRRTKEEIDRQREGKEEEKEEEKEGKKGILLPMELSSGDKIRAYAPRGHGWIRLSKLSEDSLLGH